MDRNEVLLVGRLSSTAEDKPLPGGDTLTKWRLSVRRLRHRRGSTPTDSLPCITFDPEVAAVVHALKPRAPLEVTGSLRLRVYGPQGAKVFNYEVEVDTAKPIPDEPAQDQPEEGTMQVDFLAPAA